LLCDLGDRHCRLREKAGSPMQPQPLPGCGDRLAIHRVIDAMPVIGREARDLGERVEVDVVVEMIVDMRRHPVEPAFVGGVAIACSHRCLVSSRRDTYHSPI
jgi:hypothetical protein